MIVLPSGAGSLREAYAACATVGYGRAGRSEELQRRGPGVLGWVSALLWGGSFVIPGVLGLVFHLPQWEMMQYHGTAQNAADPFGTYVLDKAP